MSSDIRQQLVNSSIAADKCWECNLIFNEVQATSNGASVEVNLSHFFKSQKTYLFPPHVHGPEQLGKLIASLQLASVKAGFLLIKSSAKTQHQLQRSKFGVYVTLGCQSSTMYKKRIRPEVEKHKQRKRTTVRPTCKEDLCPFKCNLQMYKLDHPDYGGRWILKASQANTGQHRGHLPLEPSKVTAHINKMMEQQKQSTRSTCSNNQINNSNSSSPPTVLKNIENQLNTNDKNVRGEKESRNNAVADGTHTAVTPEVATTSTSTMRSNDLTCAIQESRKEAAAAMENSCTTKEQTVVSLAREGLTLVEDNPRLYKFYMQGLKNLVENCSKELEQDEALQATSSRNGAANKNAS